MYHVKLEKFEGPLDLLHQLIETKKLEITEISLAQVADQFLSHIKKLPLDNMDDLADFLAVAGRLALIKSRALLPFLELTREQETDLAQLKDQLAEYYKIRELAQGLHKLDRSPKTIYSRDYLQNVKPVFYWPKKLAAADLKSSLADLLSTITLPQRIPQAQAIDILSLEKKLTEIETRLKEKLELKFSQILASKEPEEKIVSFLGILELVKREHISAEQKSNFEDIKLAWQKN